MNLYLNLTTLGIWTRVILVTKLEEMTSRSVHAYHHEYISLDEFVRNLIPLFLHSALNPEIYYGALSRESAWKITIEKILIQDIGTIITYIKNQSQKEFLRSVVLFCTHPPYTKKNLKHTKKLILPLYDELLDMLIKSSDCHGTV